MSSLKAAAKRLRGRDWTTPSQDKADRFIAAQSLEALAWMEENELIVKRFGVEWRCFHITDQDHRCYNAATPLAAILAAMEGEKDVQA